MPPCTQKRAISKHGARGKKKVQLYPSVRSFHSDGILGPVGNELAGQCRKNMIWGNVSKAGAQTERLLGMRWYEIGIDVVAR